MTIEKKSNGTELTITVAGRLDTTTAPELEAELKQSIAGIEKLVDIFRRNDKSKLYASVFKLGTTALCRLERGQFLGRKAEDLCGNGIERMR